MIIRMKFYNKKFTDKKVQFFCQNGYIFIM